MADQPVKTAPLFVASISVEYTGEDIDVRSDTRYAFLQAEGQSAAFDLADRYAEYLKTDEGGGYIDAEAVSVGEITGEVPSFVTLWTDDTVPEVAEDDDEGDDA